MKIQIITVDLDKIDEITDAGATAAVTSIESNYPGAFIDSEIYEIDDSALNVLVNLDGYIDLY